MPSALVLGGALARARAALGAPASPSEPGAYVHVGSLPPGRASSEGAQTRSHADARAETTDLPGDRAAATLIDQATVNRSTVDGATVDGATVDWASPAVRRSDRRDRRRLSQQRGTVQGHGRRRYGRRTSIAVAGLWLRPGRAATLLYDPGTAPGKSPSGRTGGGLAGPGAGGAEGIPIVSVHELTQNGNLPNDNLAALPYALGNDPGKYWASDIYKSSDFGGSGGFGLVLQLRGSHPLHHLTVSTPMQNWSAEVFTGSSDPAALSGWGQDRSRMSHIYGDATFSLGGQDASWALLWMIDPGPAVRLWCASFPSPDLGPPGGAPADLGLARWPLSSRVPAVSPFVDWAGVQANLPACPKATSAPLRSRPFLTRPRMGPLPARRSPMSGRGE